MERAAGIGERWMYLVIQLRLELGLALLDACTSGTLPADHSAAMQLDIDASANNQEGIGSQSGLLAD
eukprot:1159885-Pelagomonas_calceolata.AAC.3